MKRMLLNWGGGENDTDRKDASSGLCHSVGEDQDFHKPWILQYSRAVTLSGTPLKTDSGA